MLLRFILVILDKTQSIRYLGIEAGDAWKIAEQTEIWQLAAVQQALQSIALSSLGNNEKEGQVQTNHG